jgi:hypothetical protein
MLFILRRNERDMITNVYWYSCKVPSILVQFYWNLNFFRQIFEKYSNIKFHENLPLRSQVVPCDSWFEYTTAVTVSGLIFKRCRHFILNPNTKSEKIMKHIPWFVQSFFGQQMHSLLKHKMLQLTLKISLYMALHVSVHSDHHQGVYDGTLLKLQSL